ncbi:MAG: type I 3-dehydroquinate dehydratase [Acetivibrio ethanolgignens]
MALKIKELVRGSGRPKICVPMTANGEVQLAEQLEAIRKICFSEEKKCVDLLEWRIDFWENIEDEKSRKRALEKIHKEFPMLPLLFTFRSRREGGERELSWKKYEGLCRWALAQEEVDILDIELFAEDRVSENILKTKPAGKYILLSNHDFEKTPVQEDILERLSQMDRLGADILKVAVMPKTKADVLTLLEATMEMQERTEKPVVTMSMGRLGLISRLSGEIFGSAITFGTAGKASAPGQIEAGKLFDILNLLMQNGKS